MKGHISLQKIIEDAGVTVNQKTLRRKLRKAFTQGDFHSHGEHWQFKPGSREYNIVLGMLGKAPAKKPAKAKKAKKVADAPEATADLVAAE